MTRILTFRGKWTYGRSVKVLPSPLRSKATRKPFLNNFPLKCRHPSATDGCSRVATSAGANPFSLANSQWRVKVQIRCIFRKTHRHKRLCCGRTAASTSSHGLLRELCITENNPQDFHRNSAKQGTQILSEMLSTWILGKVDAHHTLSKVRAVRCDGRHIVVCQIYSCLPPYLKGKDLREGLIPFPYLRHTVCIPSIPRLCRARATSRSPGAGEVPEKARKRPKRVEFGSIWRAFVRFFDAIFAKFY
jgi:hypothetical protein